MTSQFKIGLTSGTMISLDELATPVQNPQPEFHEYRKMVRLGTMKLRGLGPQTVIWTFPLIEVEEVTQLEVYRSASPIYIQTRHRDDTIHVYEVDVNWPDPRQDGEHQSTFRGLRGGLILEFIILSEVVS
jgi:hypothetical protein